MTETGNTVERLRELHRTATGPVPTSEAVAASAFFNNEVRRVFPALLAVVEAAQEVPGHKWLEGGHTLLTGEPCPLCEALAALQNQASDEGEA